MANELPAAKYTTVEANKMCSERFPLLLQQIKTSKVWYTHQLFPIHLLLQGLSTKDETQLKIQNERLEFALKAMSLERERLDMMLFATACDAIVSTNQVCGSVIISYWRSSNQFITQLKLPITHNHLINRNSNTHPSITAAGQSIAAGVQVTGLSEERDGCIGADTSWKCTFPPHASGGRQAAVPERQNPQTHHNVWWIAFIS